MTKIYIDAGHGGTDVGAIGVDGIHESDINLSVAKHLRTALEWQNVSVMMSRTEDVAKTLADRVKEANEWGADYFVSIHCNAFDNPSANGTEVFIWRKGGRAEQLAVKVLRQMLATLKTTDRGVKEDNLYVVKNTDAPAILCEIAFITNDNDKGKIDTDAEQKNVAEAICKGICEQLGIEYKKGQDNMLYKDDDKISKWAKDSVYYAKDKGYMVGDADGNFRPKDPLTRQEMAVILKKLDEVKK
jgi:N-acetylmuramoyl-L-alanine amidase